MAIEQSSEVVSRVVEELMRKCIFTKDEHKRLLSNYPGLRRLRESPTTLLEKVRRVVPNAVLLWIPVSFTHHRTRVFSFPRRYWLIYRDEPQCREAVAGFLYANLGSDIFKLAPNTALSIIKYALKESGVDEEVIRLVQERLSEALYTRKKKKRSKAAN